MVTSPKFSSEQTSCRNVFPTAIAHRKAGLKNHYGAHSGENGVQNNKDANHDLLQPLINPHRTVQSGGGSDGGGLRELRVTMIRSRLPMCGKFAALEITIS